MFSPGTLRKYNGAINPHYNRNSAGRNHWLFPSVSETSEGTSFPLGSVHVFLGKDHHSPWQGHPISATCRPWLITRSQSIMCMWECRDKVVCDCTPQTLLGGGHRSQLCYKASGALSSPVLGSAQGWPPKYRWPLNNTGLNCVGPLVHGYGHYYKCSFSYDFLNNSSSL